MPQDDPHRRSIRTILSTLATFGSATVPTPFVQYDTGWSFLIVVDGLQAVPLWYHLQAMVATTGMVPVILGDDAAYGAHVQRRADQQADAGAAPIAVTPVLMRSAAHDPLVTFRVRAERYPWQTSKEPAALAHAPQPRVPALPQFTLHTDPYAVERDTWSIPMQTMYPPPAQPEQELRMQPAARVYLALLPTGTAWHIPAYLGFDAWNDAPTLVEQLVAWRWWYERHSAIIVGVAFNTIEAWVVYPPTQTTLVERLAWEHQVYCPAVTERTDDLLSFVTGASVWTFAWH